MDQGKSGAKGQQKTHTLTNDAGETKEVTQQEWREQGKTLREQGWRRPDDDGDETADASDSTLSATQNKLLELMVMLNRRVRSRRICDETTS